MPRIAPASLQDLDVKAKEILRAGEDFMGFMPNDALVMAHQPQMLPAFLQLIGAIYGGGTVEPGLKRLIGMIASSAAGCQYCEAHTAFAARGHDIPLEKIAAIWAFETSDLFDARERAALRFAQKAALVPNAAEDADFDAMKDHFSDSECVEVLAVVSLFGFLNRWNSSLQTELEALPAALRAQLEKEHL
ncbi:MAG: carboxymuconolactone decarboxylase family protein [Pseudomonadota bacterium]